MSGVQVVVVVLAVVLVTAVVSCVLGNSKMGARLWSERRSSRAAHPTSASPHAHTAVTPTAFTHSVSRGEGRPVPLPGVYFLVLIICLLFFLFFFISLGVLVIQRYFIVLFV